MADPNVVPPEHDRRKAKRVSFEPLRIRLDGARDAILVDLSESGALLQVAGAPPQKRQFPVVIEWRNTHVPLQARVVRSEQRQVQLEAATLKRTEYHVALEFLEMTLKQSAAVKLIIQSG
jgi:hypothetical protein